MLLKALVVSLVVALATAQDNTTAFPPFSGDAFARYNITAPGITATFIPYGARLTNLWVEDKHGTSQDVVMGYDTGIQYVRDTSTIHSYMGGVVGRYANRIKNGTFQLDGQTYHIPENSGNTSTLHGGTIGYDQRNWTVVSHTMDSITFMFYDQALQGFPGDLVNIATYTVSKGPRWTSRLVSIPLNKKTPVMLSNHIYWNLGAFVNSAAQHVYDNTLHMPYSSRYVQVETSQVPNGTIGTVAGTFLDFTSPRLIGSQINNGPKNSCGVNCTGYNNAFIIDRPRYSAPESTDLVVLTMSSPQTGIQLDVRTNQQNLEIFSCNWFNGSIKAKADQQRSGNGTYDLHGCLVIEPQGWVDAINWPQWGQQEYQIYGPDTEPAVNFATYDFSIVKETNSKEEL
ncbi:hypothetical protein M409DRAFT_23783 [Zasmidium cellare ATCC 36951]|uniref:Aldose 1-epimerase n=1 Tax=Zasmidium cellare ATCC 36951 TaxID=1080233 RepID=A0A6A6CFX9_ZASCE|nr:uncharacterized protein M409DRAFT_23783 [Zasmidium cellare ATCC 36951]KAF2166055.1 hypothetical protein M409DRAFT_23783 [Zasmidium cellare ATCC 36951]